MSISLRPPAPADAEACGRIIYEAFKGIAERHNFRPDFAAVEFATDFAHTLVSHPSVFGVVAEEGGVVVGSNFLWEYNSVRAVGPVTVSPGAQARGAGRLLMEAVIERGREADGIRLVQDSFNTASLSLYASLGFEVKEPLVFVEGCPREALPDGFEVRPLREEDLGDCSDLCRRVLGFDRTAELKATPPFLTSYVAVRDGRLTAYASAPHFWALNHAVAEADEDMRALLAGVSAADGEQPLSLIVATRQAGIFRWCLRNGMRIVKPMTLMAMGRYQEPRGAYLPSVGY